VLVVKAPDVDWGDAVREEEDDKGDDDADPHKRHDKHLGDEEHVKDPQLVRLQTGLFLLRRHARREDEDERDDQDRDEEHDGHACALPVVHQARDPALRRQTPGGQHYRRRRQEFWNAFFIGLASI